MSTYTIIAILAAIFGLMLGLAVAVLALVVRDMAHLLGGMVRGSSVYKDEPTGATGIISPYRKTDAGDRKGG